MAGLDEWLPPTSVGTETGLQTAQVLSPSDDCRGYPWNKKPTKIEVHFTPEQEAQIAQIAADAGTDPEHLVGRRAAVA